MAWQVASLASVLVSAAVAVHSSAAIAPYFGSQEPWNRFCAMAVLYVITAGAIWILFRLVSNIINRVKLQEFDRQLGATFGLAKGILYCVVITFFAVTLSESSRQVVLTSHSGDLIARGIRNANPIMPEDVPQVSGRVHRRAGQGPAYPTTDRRSTKHASADRWAKPEPTDHPAGGCKRDADGSRSCGPGGGQGGGGEARKTAAGQVAARPCDLGIAAAVFNRVRPVAAAWPRPVFAAAFGPGARPAHAGELAAFLGEKFRTAD